MYKLVLVSPSFLSMDANSISSDKKLRVATRGIHTTYLERI